MPRQANRPPFYSQVCQSWCVPLSNAVISFVDEDIAHTLGRAAWSASSCESQWRALRRPWANRMYTTVYLHREIASVGIEFDVDHRTHPPHSERLIDNRRSNLRICAHTMNLKSQRMCKNNTSGFKGVIWRKDISRWAAQLMHNYKHVSLGQYDCPIEAARAYDEGAIKFFGEFALTNASLGLLP